jgi:hypothetical protein
MDGIFGGGEMTIDERIEALVQSVELMASMQSDAAEAYEERWQRNEERWLALGEQLGEERHQAAIRHDREMAEIRRDLGRAVRASIQETRNERKRRHDMAADDARRRQEIATEDAKRRQEMAADWDKRHQEMAANADKRHQELEALLKAFLERGGNGKH